MLGSLYLEINSEKDERGFPNARMAALKVLPDSKAPGEYQRWCAVV